MKAKDQSAPRILLRAWLGYSLFVLLGLLLARFFSGFSWARPAPERSNIFVCLFVAHEPLALGLTLIFLGLSFLVLRSVVPADGREKKVSRPDISLPVALLVLALTTWGTFGICHNFTLSMDEFLADFQAKIFASGHVISLVPPEWKPWAAAMTPTILGALDPTEKWVSFYLPVWAALRSVFWMLHVPWLLSPLLAAGCILLIPRILSNSGTEKTVDARAAVLLLATSPQFLINAMTAYAMTAHLFFSCLWLWFYTRPGRFSIWCCPAISLLAIGLHQPHIHALFLAPFLIRMFREKRWGLLALYAVIAISAYGFCEWWWKLGTPSQPVSVPGLELGLQTVTQNSKFQYFASKVFDLPGPAELLMHGISLTLLFSWASFATGILFTVGWMHRRQWPPLVWDLFLGIAFTIGFYLVYPRWQGHGWGFRYCHGILANISIIAAAGAAYLGSLLGQRKMERVLGTCLLVTLAVFLPLRAFQVERFVRPYAVTFSHLEKLPAEVVLLDFRGIWYGTDFMRNDPFLANRPLFVNYWEATKEQRKTIMEKPGTVYIDGHYLSQWGLAYFPFAEENPVVPKP